MSKPLLESVFEQLQQIKEVRTQTEFADNLEVTKGYMSQLLKQGGEIPTTLRGKLNKRYGVSILWMASNGEQGSMFDLVKNTPQTGDENHVEYKASDNNNLLSSQLINSQSDMNQLLTALNRMAETDLIHAKNYERLINLLEDRQTGLQRPGATGS